MDTAIQIILFFVLVGEGALTRLLYAAVLRMQKKSGGKAFSVVTDILTAIIGTGAMLVTCLLLADCVRVFYAVFFIGGIAIMHLLFNHSNKKAENEKSKALTKPKNDKSDT